LPNVAPDAREAEEGDMRTEGSARGARTSKQNAEGAELWAGCKEALGFALAASLVLMVKMAKPCYARSQAKVKPDDAPTITLRVFNYADASIRVIAQAEREAGYVFEHAGVVVIWRNCSTTRAATDCSGPFGPNDLTLRVLPGEANPETGLHEDTLGFTTATLASVYSSRVMKLARSIDADQEYATLLGDAIAHEIGHLLLGPYCHSETGIMQAHWAAESLRQGIRSLLHFTPEQESDLQIRAREMQVALRREATVPKASSPSKLGVANPLTK
jgi:hypothetical protein